MIPRSHPFRPHTRCFTRYPAAAAVGCCVAARLAARMGVALLLLAALGRFANAAEDASSAPVAATNGPTRSFREYAVPAVRLVRDDGKSVSLPDEMDDGRPVVMNFIFTTCTTICPMM